jgi:hypothetical protein
LPVEEDFFQSASASGRRSAVQEISFQQTPRAAAAIMPRKPQIRTPAVDRRQRNRLISVAKSADRELYIIWE